MPDNYTSQIGLNRSALEEFCDALLSISISVRGGSRVWVLVYRTSCGIHEVAVPSRALITDVWRVTAPPRINASSPNTIVLAWILRHRDRKGFIS